MLSRLEAVDRDARGPHLGDQQALSMAIIATERWVSASVSEANMITPIFWTVSPSGARTPNLRRSPARAAGLDAAAVDAE
jgi:hypothetical protein